MLLLIICSIDLSSSNKLYLVLKKNKRWSYVDVLDIGFENMIIFVEDIYLFLNNGKSERDKSELLEYLDFIIDININDNVLISCDIGVNSDVYLDVIYEIIVWYNYLVWIFF